MEYQPNQIPRSERFIYGLSAAALVLYGIVGLIRDDLYIPGRRSRGFHLHGTSLWIMLVAILFGVAALTALIVDHYDKRDNQRHYKQFVSMTTIAAFVVFFVAIFVNIATRR